MSEFSVTVPARRPEPPKRLSATAIGRFRTCPRQFYWADVERRPREGDHGAPLLVVANAVHEALEQFFGLPEGDRSREVLHKALRWVWPRHRTADTFASREEEAHWGHRALHLLDAFPTTFGIGGTPLARERWVKATLATGLEVFTKVDRIDPAGDGVVEIIDYKTGKLRTLQEVCDDPASWVAIAGIEATMGLRVQAVRHLFLADSLIVNWPLGDEDRRSTTARLEQTAAHLQADQQFDASPGTHCRRCPYGLICPSFGQVAVEDIVVAEDIPF